MQEEQNQWDLYLDAILFSYRVSRQDSTKLSPFYLMYGRQARLPIDFNINRPRHADEEECENEFPEEAEDMNLEFEESLQTMVAVRQKALDNIHVAQGRQKALYDAKHCRDKSKYKVGSLVLVKNSRKHSRKGSKLEPNWHGPYKIYEVLNKGTFRLCHVSTGEILNQLFNMTRLKLYFTSENSNDCVSSSSSSETPILQPTISISDHSTQLITPDNPSFLKTSDSSIITSNSQLLPLSAPCSSHELSICATSNEPNALDDKTLSNCESTITENITCKPQNNNYNIYMCVCVWYNVY